MDVRPMSGPDLAVLRALFRRMNAAQQRLGALDLQVARAEAARAEARCEVQREVLAVEGLINQQAQSLGVSGPGWAFDEPAGVFRKA